jgi:catechol 2,3-dioxygenase-like lactoylglutathione lyase family enzyme
MIDHIGFMVADHPRSRAFYVQALAPLGFAPMLDVTREQSGGYGSAGFGPPQQPQLWIGSAAAHGGAMHVAFAADSRADVDVFYAAALAAGGRDNGASGLDVHYQPNYYGAFALDPNGHNIEAVCHPPAG